MVERRRLPVAGRGILPGLAGCVGRVSGTGGLKTRSLPAVRESGPDIRSPRRTLPQVFSFEGPAQDTQRQISSVVLLAGRPGPDARDFATNEGISRTPLRAAQRSRPTHDLDARGGLP